MNWLQKIMTPKTRAPGAAGGKGKVPEGVWEKCAGCGTVLYKPELEKSLMVCPKCGHHHGLEHDVAEGLGEAGKDEDVRAGIVRGQVVAASRAREDDIRMRGFERRAAGDVADDYTAGLRHPSGEGAIRVDRHIQVLFRRHAPDAEHYGRVAVGSPRRTQVVVAAVGMEALHAAPAEKLFGAKSRFGPLSGSTLCLSWRAPSSSFTGPNSRCSVRNTPTPFVTVAGTNVSSPTAENCRCWVCTPKAPSQPASGSCALPRL